MMGQLIKISTTDIQIEQTTRQGYVKQSTQEASHNMTRIEGGLSIKSSLAKLHIDQSAAFDSVTPSTKTAIAQAASKGERAVDESMQKYVSRGKQMMNAQVGEDVLGQIAASTIDTSISVALDFLPKAEPTFTYEPGDLQIQYETDKLKFDWRVQQLDLELVPTEIDFTVVQKPSIEVEYIGDPIYVPSDFVPGAV